MMPCWSIIALCKQGVEGRDIIVYGESLGTGVAVQVAARRSIAALILEAPYTSLSDLVRHRLRIIPAYTFLKDEFNSIEHIKKVTAPLLIVHSLGDTVIPIAFGRWLFEAASGPKQFFAHPWSRTFRLVPCRSMAKDS